MIKTVVIVDDLVGRQGLLQFSVVHVFSCILRVVGNRGQTWAATISDALFSTMIKIVVIVDDLVGQTRAATIFCRQCFKLHFKRCRKQSSAMGCYSSRRPVFSCILTFLLYVIA